MTPGRALDEAFAACPRKDFLPEGERRFARLDRPLPIGWGQTNSQPTTVRTMLALLDVRAGQRVLDVGCGSAWTTALLAHLVGPDGSVVGVEIVPGLVAFGRSRLGDRPNARVVEAVPGVLGLPDGAPYDRILVSAEASTLPVPLVEQLAEDGVLVAPVRGTLLEVRPGPEVVERGRYAFVPLVDG
jgi:protein-L-isoaspartate(D-aspartate) O-methyltransferase